MQEQNLALYRKVNGPENPDTLHAMDNLGYTYAAVGRADETLKLREQLLPLCRKVFGAENAFTLTAVQNLAISSSEMGRLAEALPMQEQVLALRRKVLGPEHPDTLAAMNNLADFYFGVGRNDEATALLGKVLDLDPKNTDSFFSFGVWQAWRGQSADYESTRRGVIQLAQQTTNGWEMVGRAAEVACVQPLPDAALLAKALGLAQRSMELGTNEPDLPWSHLALGMAQYRNSQYASAAHTLAVLEEMVSTRDALWIDQKRDILGAARLFHAMSLFRQNKPDEARKLFSQAEAEMPPLPKDENHPVVAGRLFDADLTVAWLAYKEAKALLEGSAAPIAAPSGSK
jgi:tetratricopeptide (TPR) repeat protein